MRTNLRVFLGATGLMVLAGCGHGGGGGWLVGKSGLMAQVDDNDQLGKGYDLGATMNLNAIACRYEGEAWVAGDQGTLLYTNDGGLTWLSQTVPTAADLRTLATQDAGPVFVAGNGVFLTSSDTGAHWSSLATKANFRSLAASQESDAVLAVSDDGGVWSYASGALSRVSTVEGAHAVAVSPNGKTIAVVGKGISVSHDGGVTFAPAVATAESLNDVNVLDNDGTITAVGEHGAIVHVSFDAVSVQHMGDSSLRTVHISSWDDEGAKGYAAGEGGTVLITHDGGWTWELGPNVGQTVLGADQVGLGHR